MLWMIGVFFKKKAALLDISFSNYRNTSYVGLKMQTVQKKLPCKHQHVIGSFGLASTGLEKAWTALVI